MTDKPRYQYTDIDGMQLTVEPDITTDVIRVVVRIGRDSVVVPVAHIPTVMDGLEDVAEMTRAEARS